MESDFASGQQSAWALIKKIAEGFTGEVFLAESLIEKREGILKRPYRSAFASDAIRQAAQLKTEARILKTLNAAFELDPFGVTVPALLDQSKPGSDFTERFFIVIEKARGVDLNAMLRDGDIPDHLLLTVISRLFDTFERIHARRVDSGAGEAFGILWNDVKLDHLFWEAATQRLTLIDWSNGQFLEEDGRSKDRSLSAESDLRQFVATFGQTLQNRAPHLFQRLSWPEALFPGQERDQVAALRARVAAALHGESSSLEEARQMEAALLRPGQLTVDTLSELDAVHRQIVTYGALPDYGSAHRLAAGLAALAARDDRLDDVQKVCRWAAALPGERQRWDLAARLAKIPGRSTGDERRLLLAALECALGEDWSGALWSLAAAIQHYPEPAWWFDLSTAIRRLELKADGDTLRPSVLASRFALTLESRLRYAASADGDEQHARLEAAARRLRDEVIPNWTRLDPAPPYSGLAYSEIDTVLDELGADIPGEVQPIARGLAQAKAQARAVSEAWERQDFLAAARALRVLLAWDPDRKRALRADAAIQNAPAWLKTLQRGPEPSASLLDFVTALEFEGREMRNQVAPAAWLDNLLDALRSLRRGTYPTDLLAQLPELARAMPWLRRYARGPLEASGATAEDGGASAALQSVAPAAPATASGETRGVLGKGRDLYLHGALDAWVPEARGSSARVLQGYLKSPSGETCPAAIKLMRTDKVDYALPLFLEEARIMRRMDGVPGMTPMLECGFIRLDDHDGLPSDLDLRANGGGDGLNGSLERLAPDLAERFIDRLDERVSDGWIPYLAFLQRRPQDNLLSLCDAGINHGTFLPVTDLLQMAIQICDIIAAAHQRNIVYRDHKILHYYWDDDERGIYVIDWNVARLHHDPLPDIEIHMDLVQFGARGLHHILTGRAAPGALPLGPTRPDEIESAAQSYQPQWTYDDQRLSDEVKQVLERVLAGEYTSALALRDDLKRAFMLLPANKA